MLKNLKNFSLPEVEEQVLKFWKEHSIKEQAFARNKKDPSAKEASGRPAGRFVFFEGPPTANGMPGLHHLLARSFKDIIPRFKAMQGFDVPRKAGWDTHGLPVELQAEKELGFTGKQDIEKYGIAEFNQKCRELVWKYKKEFESTTTDRLGFWLDLEKPYVTYSNDYIESLWWIISQIHKKKLLYQGHKIVPWCTRCGTALSSHELAQGYKEVEDTSVYVKFKLTKESAKKFKQIVSSPKSAKGGSGTKEYTSTYILSWTTTPWTLPGNVALAVGEKIEYVAIKIVKKDEEWIASSTRNDSGDGMDSRLRGNDNEIYILAADRLPVLFPDSSKFLVLSSLSGKDLLGLQYEPLFDVKPLKTKKAYKVYPANFVTTTDGTGVVHTAVMYGEDDYQLGTALGLPQHHTVNEQGHFTKEVKVLAGLYARSGKAQEAIIARLTKKGMLLKTELYKHEYPHCWRCNTALLYYARTSWFVGMSKLRKQLLASNAKINWTPSHIKEGRFGEWLKEVKDWNFSRERYWGTPLPIWRSKDHKQEMTVSSLADFKKYGNLQGNKFFGLRHGEASHNLEGKIAGGLETLRLRSSLTLPGIEQAKAAIKQLHGKKIDVIVASPYFRAQQTAEIVAKALKKKVVTEKRFGEINCGVFNWQSEPKYHALFPKKMYRWNTGPDGAETLSDVRARTVAAIRDLNKKYKNKNILIISHGDPLWILEGAMRGQTEEEFFANEFYPKFAVPFEIDPPVLPFDAQGKLDLHRPYIDQVVLIDPKTKKELHRVKEVCDVWFDSGAMPYAQAHFPFAQAGDGKVTAATFKKLDYPADFICEAMDQTRGWFYTLLAISTLLDLPAPYKNVTCLGLIHDKNGQKMSKSKGNIVDPMMIMQKYGADAVRWYFYTVNNPGDAKNFDENDLAKITRRFILILYNSFVFWNAYGRPGEEQGAVKSTNVLDRWITARLNQLIQEVQISLEQYEVGKAAGMIEAFTDDLSRWYIRRSRDRFQSNARGESGREDDYRNASITLHQTLLTLSTLTAPFMPFLSDAMYKSLAGKKVSVHLADWPVADTKALDKELLRDMQVVREAAAAALALRATVGIKVRQPLQSLTLKNTALRGKEELLKILIDEVNVKEILFDPKLQGDQGLVLDTLITQVLREEGLIRELSRAIQGLRADANYQMGDEVILYLSGSDGLTDLIQRSSLQLKKAVNAKTIEFKKQEGVDVQLETKLEEWPLWIGLKKA